MTAFCGTKAAHFARLQAPGSSHGELQRSPPPPAAHPHCQLPAEHGSPESWQCPPHASCATASQHGRQLPALYCWWRPCAENTLHTVDWGFFFWLVVLEAGGGGGEVLVFLFLIFLNWLHLGLQVKLEWKARRKNKRSLKLTLKPTASNVSAIHFFSNLSLLPF